MNKNQEVCTVIRDKHNEVTAVLVSQVHIHSHIFYKAEKMGVEDIMSTLQPSLQAPLPIKTE